MFIQLLTDYIAPKRSHLRYYELDTRHYPLFLLACRTVLPRAVLYPDHDLIVSQCYLFRPLFVNNALTQNEHLFDFGRLLVLDCAEFDALLVEELYLVVAKAAVFLAFELYQADSFLETRLVDVGLDLGGVAQLALLQRRGGSESALYTVGEGTEPEGLQRLDGRLLENRCLRILNEPCGLQSMQLEGLRDPHLQLAHHRVRDLLPKIVKLLQQSMELFFMFGLQAIAFFFLKLCSDDV